MIKKNLIYLIGGIVISAAIIIGGLFYYKKVLTPKVDEQKQINMGLQSEYDSNLNEQERINNASLQMEIEKEEESTGKYKDIYEAINSYPNGLTKKQTLLDWERYMSLYGLSSSSISMSDPVEVGSIIRLEDKAYSPVKSDTTVSYEGSYEGIKKFIKNARKNNRKYGINSISINFTDNGVSGELILSEYALKNIADESYTESYEEDTLILGE